MIEKVQLQLSRAKVDAYIGFDFRGNNDVLREIFNFNVPTTRRFVVIVERKMITWLIPEIEYNHYKNMPGEKVVYTDYQEFKTELGTRVKEFEVVAVDMYPENSIPALDIVPSGFVELLNSSNNKLRLVPINELLHRFLAYWGMSGRRSHKEAVEKIELLFQEAKDFLRFKQKQNKKLTEAQLVEHIWKLYVKCGLSSEANRGIMIASNENTANPHYFPDAENPVEIRQDSLILIDIWGRLKSESSIYADLTKMFWFGDGDVPQKFSRPFNDLARVRDQAIIYIENNIDEGFRGYEADEMIQLELGALGYSRNIRHRSGHSLGRRLHDLGTNIDDFETHDDRNLIAGTGFTLEPGLYFSDFGVRSELNVYLDTNFELLIFGKQDRIELL